MLVGFKINGNLIFLFVFSVLLIVFVIVNFVEGIFFFVYWICVKFLFLVYLVVK